MRHGFTLAEVLITLMIIGIVAALTIPSVISNYQQQEFKTGLKKAVSVLNEAIQTNIAQDGETPYDTDDIFAYLQKHLSIIKTGSVPRCKQFRSNGDGVCSTSDSNQTFYTTDGMRFEFSRRPNSLYLHESGVNISENKRKGYLGSERMPWGEIRQNYQYSAYNSYCGSYGLAANPNSTETSPCSIVVDVNGDKKPNSIVMKDYPYTDTGAHGETIQGSAQYADALTYPSPSDKKVSDVFTIMITDEKAIPFGVVAQRAMYSK